MGLTDSEHTDAPPRAAAPSHLREGDIRPESLMEQQAAHFAADVARLLTKADGFVGVSCPACGGESATPAFDKSGFSYVTCDGCETIYLSPRPTPELLHEYYADSENYRFWAENIFPASEDVRRERIFRPRVDRLLDFCARHRTTTGVLVEVGAGFGTFCEEVQKSGVFHQVVAVEPTPELAAGCRRRGITVVDKPIEAVGDSEVPVADVIASFETIEHLFDPGAFVHACARRLRPGGLLVLTCPNGQGFDVLVLGPRSDTVDAEHLNYFNPESLRRLVTSAGLDVLEVSTPGELDAQLVRRKALSGEYDVSESPFLNRVLVEEWDRLSDPFQDFLAANLLSSHMWLVARKPRQ